MTRTAREQLRIVHKLIQKINSLNNDYEGPNECTPGLNCIHSTTGKAIFAEQKQRETSNGNSGALEKFHGSCRHGESYSPGTMEEFHNSRTQHCTTSSSRRHNPRVSQRVSGSPMEPINQSKT